ncbi:uncharacterized protein [Nicotiana tomentosiformis]|uniref:uncharacterized protein n=1 Tax=Nicotiana tomentosiformis TaxID=4098 RepID=UPI00388CD444
MAKGTGDNISFQRAVDISRRIEMVRVQERGPVCDKRPRHSGGFSGTSSGGRGTFGRIHPPRPFQSALQASHSASSSHGPYVSHSGFLAYCAPSAPISALRSKATTVVIWLVRVSFSISSHNNKRGISSMGVLVTSGARGRIQSARGGGQAVRDRGQAVRGGGQPTRGRPRDEGQGGGAQPQFYAFLARPEAELSNVIIIGTFLVFHRDASVLFDPSSTYSYVSSYFSSYLVVPRDCLSVLIYVSMPVGDSIVDCVYRSCVISIRSLETNVDFLLLDMVDFGVILGID